MTITVANPPAGSISPGLDIRGSVSGFTVLAGDYVELNIPFGLFVLSGTKCLVTDVALGVWQGHVHLDEVFGTDWFYAQIAAPAGTAVALSFLWRRAGGTVVDTLSIPTGYFWEPAGAIPGMLNHVYQQLLYLQGQIDGVLNAVRRQFPLP